MPGAPSRLTARIAERALTLRVAGMSYSRIADELGVDTPDQAYRAVEHALRETTSWETRADAGVLEVERLNRLTEALWERAELTGDIKAIEALTKLIARRANLLGLNFRDLVASKRLELEAGKVQLIARALSTVLSRHGITGEVYDSIVGDLTGELRQIAGPEPAMLSETPEAYVTVPLDDEDDDGDELI